MPERLAIFARTARELAGTSELTGLLGELTAEGRYGRLTALGMAAVAGDRAHLLAQLDSPDPECAGSALSALVRLGTEPDVVLPRLPHLSQRMRRRLWRALAHGSRERLADAVLPVVRARFGDAEAARVLPSCSADVVAEALPELAYAVPSWSRLCRRHTALVFDRIAALEPDAGPNEWRQWWARLTANVTVAAHHDPARLLDLAERAIEHVPIVGLRPVAGALARHDADAVRRLILHPSGRGRDLAGPAAVRALRGLPDAPLRELFEACPAAARPRFLRAVPPARRAALAERLLLRPGTAPADVDTAVLDALPRTARAAVARELLSRPGGADVPAVADSLSARLPWPEAESSLRHAVRRPAAEDRARAYPLLVTAAAGARDPAVLGALLASLTRLRNEQDPVRSSALRAVASVPASLLTTAHLPALEQLATDALEARDRSYQTSRAVETLAHIMLTRAAHTGEQAFTDSALRVVGGLAEAGWYPSFTGMHHNLARGAERRLVATLHRRLSDDADRDRWYLTLALAAGLAERAYGVPELQDLLLRACTAADDRTVRAAVPLALADRATRDAHLDDILHRDRSLITLSEVQHIVGRRRTDLLDTLLNRSTPGRFLPAQTRVVPMFLAGCDRWSPHQVEHYARLLDSYARHEKASIAERASAVRKLGTLPGSFDRLSRYVDATDLVVAEAALTALGGSDEPRRALSVLTRHVADDRARVAVSGVAACARGVPSDELGAALAPLLASPKVTAVKEGVRLLATLPAPDATQVIGTLWDRPDVHRDVRRAVVAVLPLLLRDPGMWRLLDAAAADPEVADAVTAVSPYALPEQWRHRFAALVCDLATRADHRIAAPALQALVSWYPWAPPTMADILVDRLTDRTEVGLWPAALRALMSAATGAADPTAVLAAVDRLRRDEDTLVGRDLPARQRLEAMVRWLMLALRTGDTARPIATRVAGRLVADPLWHEQVIALTSAAVRWTEPERTVDAIESLSPIAVGALLTRPAHHLTERLGHDAHRVATARLVPTATGLVAASGLSTTLAAVALIAVAGARSGWEAPWPDLLAGLRAHPDIDVRRAAHAVFTAPE